MRVVLDTNVLVSAFLSPDGAPAQLLTFALAGELTLLFDDRIMAEYAEVLRRPRFGLDEADIDLVLRQLEADGERVEPTRSTLDFAGRVGPPLPRCGRDGRCGCAHHRQYETLPHGRRGSRAHAACVPSTLRGQTLSGRHLTSASTCKSPTEECALFGLRRCASVLLLPAGNAGVTRSTRRCAYRHGRCRGPDLSPHPTCRGSSGPCRACAGWRARASRPGRPRRRMCRRR